MSASDLFNQLFTDMLRNPFVGMLIVGMTYMGLFGVWQPSTMIEFAGFIYVLSLVATLVLMVCGFARAFPSLSDPETDQEREIRYPSVLRHSIIIGAIAVVCTLLSSVVDPPLLSGLGTAAMAVSVWRGAIGIPIGG